MAKRRAGDGRETRQGRDSRHRGEEARPAPPTPILAAPCVCEAAYFWPPGTILVLLILLGCVWCFFDAAALKLGATLVAVLPMPRTAALLARSGRPDVLADWYALDC